MATGDYDFTYENEDWSFPLCDMRARMKLHLERWSDGQIHVQCVEDCGGDVVKGWLDDAIREWVQAHQHTLTDKCFDQVEDDMDAFAERVDYEMDRAR